MKTDPSTTVPIWVYLEKEPRPIRIVRRLCIVWAILACVPVLWSVVQDTASWPAGVGTTEGLRMGLAVGLSLFCAARWRHIAMYYLRWCFPLLYLVILPSWRWILLPAWVVFAVPYIRYMAQHGVRAWYRISPTLEGRRNRAETAS